MLSDTDKLKILGKLSGHNKEFNARISQEKRERIHAERKSDSIILTKEDVRGEKWDAGRILETTLGGVRRQITSGDLAVYRKNIQTVGQLYSKGITARQIIGLAHGRPLANVKGESDIDRANQEIQMAVPISVVLKLEGVNRVVELRMITNSGPKSRISRHYVIIRFNNFKNILTSLASSTDSDIQNLDFLVGKMVEGYLSFDCDCGRHRYWYRYISTIGGFNAGREEYGYPKIRNPYLKGVACKHVLRVMSELKSVAIKKYLVIFLEKTRKSSDFSVKHQTTQSEAKELATRNIKEILAVQKAVQENAGAMNNISRPGFLTRMVDKVVSKTASVALKLARKILPSFLQEDIDRILKHLDKKDNVE